MRKGDIVVNPWVSTYFNGELNPNYATIYLGDNRTLDYEGRVCEWADKIYKDDPRRETPWKVIGHIDLYGIAELAIRDAVFAEEISDTPQKDCETCKHYGVVSVSCDRCDKSTHSKYEPQTECGRREVK